MRPFDRFLQRFAVGRTTWWVLIHCVEPGLTGRHFSRTPGVILSSYCKARRLCAQHPGDARGTGCMFEPQRDFGIEE